MRENDGKWREYDTVKERTFTLNDSKEDGSYDFFVSAVNEAGQGQAISK